MTIYFIKDDAIDSVEFDNVANLEALERELDDTYDYWNYDRIEFTCADCDYSRYCEFAYDLYNTNGDCLEDK